MIFFPVAVQSQPMSDIALHEPSLLVCNPSSNSRKTGLCDQETKMKIKGLANSTAPDLVSPGSLTSKRINREGPQFLIHRTVKKLIFLSYAIKVLVFCVCLSLGSHHLALAGLELANLKLTDTHLPLPPRKWD